MVAIGMDDGGGPSKGRDRASVGGTGIRPKEKAVAKAVGTKASRPAQDIP